MIIMIIYRRIKDTVINNIKLFIHKLNYSVYIILTKSTHIQHVACVQYRILATVFKCLVLHNWPLRDLKSQLAFDKTPKFLHFLTNMIPGKKFQKLCLWSKGNWYLKSCRGQNQDKNNQNGTVNSNDLHIVNSNDLHIENRHSFLALHTANFIHLKPSNVYLSRLLT